MSLQTVLKPGNLQTFFFIFCITDIQIHVKQGCLYTH